MKASIEWQSDFKFSCINEDFVTQIDASIEHGGKNSAPTPKMLLLNSLMGCCAIDTLSTLKKMRLVVQSFNVTSNATESIDYPIHFNQITLSFILTGNLKKEKVITAISKSLKKYCGISYMLSKSCEIFYTIELNDKQIYRDKVNHS